MGHSSLLVIRTRAQLNDRKRAPQMYISLGGLDDWKTVLRQDIPAHTLTCSLERRLGFESSTTRTDLSNWEETVTRRHKTELSVTW